MRTKKRKKRGSHLRVVPASAAAPNERWSMDFVADSLLDGRAFRALTVVDNFSRESLIVQADFSLTGAKVAAALDRVCGELGRGYPKMITVDNGTEFYSRAMGLPPRGASGLHPARPPRRECVHRELQRPASRRVPERRSVLLHR